MSDALSRLHALETSCGVGEVGPSSPSMLNLVSATPANSARLLRRLHGARIVVEQGSEPALRFRECPAFAPGVIFHLVAFDLADAEIARVRMAEIQPRNGGARPH